MCRVKHQSFLDRAALVATRSSVKTHRHGCVIVNKDGDIISEGYNYYTTHMEHKWTIHAEVDALMKVKKIKKQILAECTLYVVRIGTDFMGNPLKYSQPCTDCAKAICKSGIKKIFFSTDDEFLVKIKYIEPGYVAKNYTSSPSSSTPSSSSGSSSKSSKSVNNLGYIPNPITSCNNCLNA